MAAAFLLALLLPVAFAQTFTECNPTLRSDCPTNPALGTNATFDFTKTRANSDIWKSTEGKAVSYTSTGADFTIGGAGDSPTIQSNFYLFFGTVSVLLRAASGRAIVSSIVLQSETLDEIDWEWLGQNTTHVQTNYFGKGDTTSYDRDIWHEVPGGVQNVHNYTLNWTREKLEWYIDDKLIRTLKYEEAQGGARYPQTPMNIRLGIWSGGDPKRNSEGTIAWAGGLTDFKQAPFTMTVPEVYAQDFSSGKSYKYGDKSGSWQSIVVEQGKSVAEVEITSPHGVTNRFNALPKAAQIGIIAGSISVAAVLFALLIFCCIKQRRAGRRERQTLDDQYARGQAELMEYKRKLSDEETAPRRMYPSRI